MAVGFLCRHSLYRFSRRNSEAEWAARHRVWGCAALGWTLIGRSLQDCASTWKGILRRRVRGLIRWARVPVIVLNLQPGMARLWRVQSLAESHRDDRRMAGVVLGLSCS